MTDYLRAKKQGDTINILICIWPIKSCTRCGRNHGKTCSAILFKSIPRNNLLALGKKHKEVPLTYHSASTLWGHVQSIGEKHEETPLAQHSASIRRCYVPTVSDITSRHCQQSFLNVSQEDKWCTCLGKKHETPHRCIRRNHAQSESKNTRHREHTLLDLPDEITYWLWVETQGNTMSTSSRTHPVRSPTICGKDHRKIHWHTLAGLSASFQRDDVRSEGRKTRRHYDQSFMDAFEEATHCLCAKTPGDTISTLFWIHIRRSRTSWWRKHKEARSVRISACMKRYHAQSSSGKIRRHWVYHYAASSDESTYRLRRKYEETPSEHLSYIRRVADEITYPLLDYQCLFLRVSQEITYFLWPIT